MTMLKKTLTGMMFFWGTACWVLGAAVPLPDVQIIPWNGHKAAVSLTFDDSDPSHLDVAIPELNQRKMRGTFYLIANRTDRKDEWRQALTQGHELGNHTLDHKHANELTARDEEAQVMGAQNVLQKEFGVPIRTFAYPYSDITPTLKAWVGKGHLLARGGYGDYDMKPASEPDWLNIPSRNTMTALPIATYRDWIDQDLKDNAWLVFVIHGLEGTPWGWEPITRQNFEAILDYLQSKDIWVETFLGVGSYFRAEKVFESCQVNTADDKRTWDWNIPENFPTQVVLCLRIKPNADGSVPSVELSQGGNILTPDDTGLYRFNFSGKELVMRLLPKR